MWVRRRVFLLSHFLSPRFLLSRFFLCNVTVYHNVGNVTWVTSDGDMGGDKNG